MAEGDLATEPENYVDRYKTPPADPGFTSSPGERAMQSTGPFTESEVTATFPKPMSDEQAHQDLIRYPSLTGAEKDAADKRFQTYFEDQDRRKKWDDQQSLQKQLTDPQAKKDFYETPEVKAAAQELKDPNAMYARHVVTNYLENRLGRPLVDGEYQGAKNNLIGIQMNGTPKIDDLSAFGVLQKDAEKDVEAQQLSTEVHSALLTAHFEALQPGGKPFQIGDVFDTARGKHAELLKEADNERRAYTYVQAENAKMEALFLRNAPQLQVAYDYLKRYQKNVGATTDEELQAVVEAVRSIPHMDRAQAKAYLVDAVRAGDADPALFKNLQRVASNLFGVPTMWNQNSFAAKEVEIESSRNQLLDGTAKIGPDGMFVYPGIGGKRGYDVGVGVTGIGTEAEQPNLRKPTEEEIRNELSRLNDDQEQNNVLNQLQAAERQVRQPNPYFSKDAHPFLNTMERGAYSLNDQAAMQILGFATHRFPLLGHYAYTMLIGNQYFADAMAAEPDMDPRVARTSAYLGAAVESVEEQIQWKALRAPKTLQALFVSLRTKGPVGYLKFVAGHNLIEQTEEAIQDFSTAVINKWVREAAHAMDPSMNVGNIETLDKITKDWVDQRADVAATVFWMSLITAGFATHEHLHDPIRTVFNDEYLSASGMDQARINTIMSTPDPAKRIQVYRDFMLNRSSEDRARGIEYAQNKAAEATAAVGATINQQEGQRPLAGLKSVVVDGERKWQVLDEKGSVVRDNLDADTAMDELDSYQQMLDKEWNLQEATKAASEEEVARQTEAETRWNVLEPRDRTTAGNILEFEHVEPTPANQQAHDLLQRAVAARNAAGISKDNVGLVNVLPPTQAGRNAVNFVRWFERTFGKQVVFVASKDGQPLSFGGLVVKGLPNTIFLDATGDRNLLSVLGHEWSHTLEQTNPKLWAAMVEKMKPLFVDWTKARAEHGKGYDLDQMTPETIANVIGDAFSDPDFWATVRDRHSGLFERIRQAILDWFDTIIDHATEWGTQAIIHDLKGMRNIIAQAMEQAQEGAEVTTPEESTIGAQSALPRPHEVYSEGVSESFREQDIKRERRKIERERRRIKQVETDAIVRRRLVESRVTFGQAKASIYGRGLRRDYGESEERSGELERYVTPDPRLIKKYGTGMVKYDRNGYPIPNEVEEVPENLLVSTDQHATAIIDHELARELNVRAGEIPRAKLHDAIVRKFINRGDPEKGKLAFLSGGGGGSGKSTLMSNKEGMNKEGREGYVHIDADEIRALLPEYRELIKWRDPRAAELSHEESSALGKRIFAEALAEDLPILYDATFANPKKNIPGIIDKMKEKQYKIRMMGIIIDPHEAIVRAFERAKKTGRYVYPKILLEAHQGFLEAVRDGLYNEALGRESVHIYDNTGESAVTMQHRDLPVPADLRAEGTEDPAPSVESATQGQAATPRSYERMAKEAEPRKTIKAYKIFRQDKSGGLHPLFIDKGTVVPVGQWLEARNVPTKEFQQRPGWHAGVLPFAPHLRQTSTGMRDPARVWAEVEMPADVQWQHIADASSTKDIRDQIPVGGTYQFKTSQMQGGGWRIGGALKVNRVLSDADVAGILRKNNQEGEIAAETRGSQASARRDTHKFAALGPRKMDPNGGYIAESEEATIAGSVNKWLDSKKLTGTIREQRFAEAMDQIRADVMSTRARNPDASTVAGKEDPWSTLEVTGAKAEFKPGKPGQPDVVKAVARWKKQNYRFDEVPEGMTQDQWSTELADRVISQYIEQLKMNNADSKLIVQELEWYREFTKKLRQDFGGAADFMADLLGAFSPRQNVQLNFRNAVDAIWAISNGKYDKLLSDLDAYLKADPDNTIGTWRKEGRGEMTARSGALFGTNTERGMAAALGLWRAIKAGDKPKAKNFTRNLIALSHKATVDVWAARLLDRVAGKPRIPNDGEGAVSGSHLTETELEKQFGPDFTGDIPVKGQFAFGQDVFAKVAALMRDPKTWEGTGIDPETTAKFANVTPADVQATNWFVEKAIWTKNGWTNEAGSGGSFIGEIEAMVGTRFQAGLAQARPDFIPNDIDQRDFVTSVRNDLAGVLPEVISMRVMDSLGMFKDFPVERSTDLELTHGPGLEPYDLVRTILSYAQQKDQDATHVSRVLEYWEQNDNSRPGVEVYLKSERGLEVIQPIMDMLNNSGISGFTAIVDPRAKGGRYVGVRFQYIPEYSDDGPNWQKQAATIRETLFKLERTILEMPHVASVRMQEYDTVVFKKGSDYDNTGVYEGALGRSEVAAWRRGYFDSVAEKAVRRNARDVLVEQHEHDVSHREQAGAPSGPARAGPITVTAFDPALMGFKPQEVVPSQRMLKQLNEEAKVYDQILKCLS